MRSKWHNFFLGCILLTGSSVFGGTLTTHFTFTANTGTNATIGIPSSINPTIGGIAIAVGDEIGVFTPDGLCVGGEVWTGSSIAIPVWGDNDQTLPVDGIAAGAEMQFRMWRQSTNTEYTAQVTYTQGNGLYTVNGIYQLASLDANVSSGPHFSYTANTGNNATIGIQSSINPTICGNAIAVGDEIGVFTPAGLCVGSVVWTGSNIAVTVWGDNDQTSPIDGIGAGEQMKFRVWRQSTNTEYPAQVTYSQGSSVYAANGVYVLGSLVTTSSGISIKLKIFLEGPLSGTTMTTALAISGYIPTAQPYTGAPFDYSGTESVSGSFFTTNSIVDWILVELRSTAAGPAVDRRAALLKSDGTVLETDGTTCVSFPTAAAGNYFIVIRHRNHLAIMSAATVTLPNATAYDFTTAQAQAYGTNPMQHIGSVYGMYSGEAYDNSIVFCDGSLNSSDFDVWLPKAKAGVTGYSVTDWNMDGQNLSDDFDLWLPNAKKNATSQVP